MTGPSDDCGGWDARSYQKGVGVGRIDLMTGLSDGWDGCDWQGVGGRGWQDAVGGAPPLAAISRSNHNMQQSPNPRSQVLLPLCMAYGSAILWG